MKLDRNINADGMGKYALLKLRKLDEFRESEPFGEIPSTILTALEVLEAYGILDRGRAGTEAEFFVIRLKDKYAGDALGSYALAAMEDDREYAYEIAEMAARAGMNSPWCKAPD